MPQILPIKIVKMRSTASSTTAPPPCLKCGGSGEWFLSRRERRRLDPTAGRTAQCRRCRGTGVEVVSERRRRRLALDEASSSSPPPPPAAEAASAPRQSKVKAASTRAHRNKWSKKKVRTTAFVTWLLAKLDSAGCRTGGIVLDVAGGSGRVSAHLALRHGLPCVIVDPAPVRLSQRTTRDIVRAALASASSNVPTNEDDALLRCLAADDLLPTASWLHPKGLAEAGPWASPADEATAIAAAVAALRTAGLRHACVPFDSTFPTTRASLWARVAVVVGMHPDEATDAIVDCALRSGKPFAVVPCCVFPRLFSHRVLRRSVDDADAAEDARLLALGVGPAAARVVAVANTAQDGVGPRPPPNAVASSSAATAVRSYEQYVRWLLRKSSGIVAEQLDGVPGRSVVLFRIDAVAVKV